MKMMKRLPLAGVMCCAVVSSGGSSVMSHTVASHGDYPGKCGSAEILTDSNTSWALKPLALVDLPFSAVMDTLLLPWDYYRSDSDQSLDSPRARVLQSEKLAHTEENLAHAQPMPTMQPQR